MKGYTLIAIFVYVAFALSGPRISYAELPAPEAQIPTILKNTATYRIWPGRAPGAQSDTLEETPTVTVYYPPVGWANGAAVVIAPGGGYVGLSGILEGQQAAAWFTTRGITAFVLIYRVGPKAPLPLPLEDGARAIQFVRAHAADFKIDPARLGMMGFSAGGHLTAMVEVQADAIKPPLFDDISRVSSRPDFVILAYPWLRSTKILPNGHSSYCDFRENLAKTACDPKAFASFDPSVSVPSNAPPTFIYHTSNDALVPATGSADFYDLLVSEGVPVEFHAFQSGRHGSGMGGNNNSLSEFPTLLQEWLRNLNVYNSMPGN